MTEIKSIIKRDGRLENFDTEKIKRSIKNSAKDCNIDLNNSDVDYIYKVINNRIICFIQSNNRHILSSIEIRSFIIESLKICGFNKISEEYRKI